MVRPARRGLLGFILDSAELPGERELPALLAQARQADSAAGAWATRRVEWLRRDLEGEKAALTRVFPATVIVFWTLALLTERDTRNKNLWTMLPLNGVLTIGVGLRIWLCNRLLRRFWEGDKTAGRLHINKPDSSLR